MILAGIFAFIGIKYSPMELRKMLLFVGAFYIIAAIVMFIPTLKCMQFACRANDAMRYGEQQTMEKAFANLAFATKYQGIISIICIVLAVVWIVLVVSNPTLLSTHHY